MTSVKMTSSNYSNKNSAQNSHLSIGIHANITHPSYKRKLRVRYNELEVIANIIIQDQN